MKKSTLTSCLLQSGKGLPRRCRGRSCIVREVVHLHGGEYQRQGLERRAAAVEYQPLTRSLFSAAMVAAICVPMLRP